MNRNLILLARQMRKTIGAHYRMIGNTNLTNDAYQEARSKSDQAVSLANYIIQSLENRQQAELFAHHVGMPGYFYAYKG